MNETTFKVAMFGISLAFTVLFFVLVGPPMVANPDIIGAFAGGFVNPYASGYSADVICCWLILAVWIVYESKTLAVKHGWVCLLLGLIPGVAVGFAMYLVLRNRQLNPL